MKKFNFIIAGVLLLCVGIVLLIFAHDKDEKGGEKDAALVSQSAEVADWNTDSAGADSKEETIASPDSTEVPETMENSTEETKPVLTEEYKLVYEGITLFNSGSSETFFKYLDKDADLYIRTVYEESAEYQEISLWYEQRQIWKDQYQSLSGDGSGICYYVVPIDGSVYLMRYGMENNASAVTMSYEVFGISMVNSPDSDGYEHPYDADSLTVYLVTDPDVDKRISFPKKEMLNFADTVEAYMEKGKLVNSDWQHDCMVFPWITQLADTLGVGMKEGDSLEKTLTALEQALPEDESVSMPGVAADGSYFITGNYYSCSDDESALSLTMEKDGSYGGHLYIDGVLIVDITANYENGILYAVEKTESAQDFGYEMEICFEKGKATVKITAAEGSPLNIEGASYVLDRKEKPRAFNYLKNAEDYPVN